MIQKETISEIDERMIIRQVEKICSCAEFKSKELLCRFLTYIISEYLAGRENNIKGYSIGVDVFNRGENFDPGQDALVRIHAGRLRRMLDMYYLKEGKNDPVRIEIPKGAYAPKFKYNTGKTEPKGKKDSATGDQILSLTPRVAILPFKNLTGNPDENYLAIGFAEEVSVQLTKYDDLIVFNSIPFADHNLTYSEKLEFLKEKKIRFTLDGGIYLLGKKLKILVKLTDQLKGEQIWAQSYHKDLSIDNIIDVQEKIAREISGIIGSEFGIILKNLSKDSETIKIKENDTYFAILKFYHFQANQSPEAAQNAFQALQESLKTDPNSAIVMAMLASMHCNRFLLDYPNNEVSYEQMKILTEKAIKLSPNNFTVRISLSYKHFAFNEKDLFFREADRCLSMNPGFSTVRLGALGMFIALYGDWERGKDILDEVMDMSVSYPLHLHGVTTLYYYRNKQYEKALYEALQYNVPALFWGSMLRAAVYGQLNQPQEAKSHISDLMNLKPDFNKKSKDLISRFVKEENLVEHVMEGLRNAGMKV